MSFSLSDLSLRRGVARHVLPTVFAQRRNVARPGFLAMLADVAGSTAWPASWLSRRGADRAPWATARRPSLVRRASSTGT